MKLSELGMERRRMLTVCESLVLDQARVGVYASASLMIIPILHMVMSLTIVIGTGGRIISVYMGGRSGVRASLDGKSGIGDGNGFGVLMLSMVFLSMDLLMFLEVLWALEGLVAYLTNVWLQRCVH